LNWNDFEHAVVKHLSGKGNAKENPKPLVQLEVVLAPAGENRPDGSRGERNNQQAECKYVAEHIVVAAAAVAEIQSRPDMKDVGSGQETTWLTGRNVARSGN